MFTSILPNLLVADLAQALQRTLAPKVYVCNLAVQPGETDNYTVADHYDVIADHVGAGCVDVVLANDNLTISPQTGGGQTVFVEPIMPDGANMVTADLVDEQRPWRHDSQKLGAAVMRFLA